MLITEDIESLKSLSFIHSKNPETYLDIVGKPTCENTISRVYAYYLNREVTADYFLNTLIELVHRKGKEIQWNEGNSFDAKTEHGLDDGKRIDILIRDISKNSAIIIENKVYASVTNDLPAYLNGVNIKNKTGVLLTLRPEGSRDNFVNITHLEWITAIENEVQHLLKGDFHLNDFVNAIKNLTRNMEFTNDIKLYMENAQLIEKAIAAKASTREYINAQMKKLHISLQKENDSLREIIAKEGKNYCWHIFKEKNSSVILTIYFGKLMGGESELCIIIEALNSGRKKEITEMFSEELWCNNHEIHLKVEKYDQEEVMRVMVQSEANNFWLADFLYEKMKNDKFIEVYSKILTRFESQMSEVITEI